jgi:hypothetical protein
LAEVEEDCNRMHDTYNSRIYQPPNYRHHGLNVVVTTTTTNGFLSPLEDTFLGLA